MTKAPSGAFFHGIHSLQMPAGLLSGPREPLAAIKLCRRRNAECRSIALRRQGIGACYRSRMSLDSDLNAPPRPHFHDVPSAPPMELGGCGQRVPA